MTEQAIINLTEKIVEKMESMNISRTDLTKRPGASKAIVTKILNGNPNLTTKTIVSIANAMDCKIDSMYPVGDEIEDIQSVDTGIMNSTLMAQNRYPLGTTTTPFSET